MGGVLEGKVELLLLLLMIFTVSLASLPEEETPPSGEASCLLLDAFLSRREGSLLRKGLSSFPSLCQAPQPLATSLPSFYSTSVLPLKALQLFLLELYPINGLFLVGGHQPGLQPPGILLLLLDSMLSCLSTGFVGPSVLPVSLNHLCIALLN